MSDTEDFHPSDSDLSFSEHQPVPAVSVLKHLPAPRALLCPQHTNYELYSPRCLFTVPLSRVTQSAMPRVQQLVVQPIYNRLISIQEASFEHLKIKEKIRQLHDKSQKDCINTLWDIYGDREIYYCRFEPSLKKLNLATLYMSIAGINLQAKKSALPQIKQKLHNNNKPNTGSVIFDSHFESGNLLYVFRNNQQHTNVETYDLILQNDINTKGHNQWFYFKVMNTRKNQKIRFNIINLVKKESLFSYGLKPLIFSQKNQSIQAGWRRCGERIHYQQNSIKRQHKNQPYHTLSFQYQFRQAYDNVLFAPSYPYTYTHLLHYLDGILTNKNYQQCLSIKKLCETAGRNAINLISISTGKTSLKQSKIIWILARQHPVQTTSSFMVEGIINHLLQIMQQASQQNSSFFDKYLFKIVPMVNPDGVIHGNTRAQITGLDPNRVWNKPSKNVTPSIYTIKKHILNSKDQTCLVLDLHSHSKKMGCFFYGNYNSSDVASYRILPSMVCQKDIRFCYKNCRFRGGNQNSARRSLFKQLNMPHIYTVQCSQLGYIKDNRICQYKILDYHQMGKKIIDTFFQLQKQNLKSAKITTYPHSRQDFCDAQSARSDSCVSQDQYPEVYAFARLKNKVKISQRHKSKLKSTYIPTHKHHTSQHPRPTHISSNKLKDNLKSDTIVPEHPNSMVEKRNNHKSKQFIADDCQQKKEGFGSLKNKINARHIRLTAKKKLAKTIKEEIANDISENKIIEKELNQKSVQVQQLRNTNFNVQLRTKQNKKLIVFGSGVEDQRIYVGKNEVGVQKDIVFKENLQGSPEGPSNFKPNSSSYQGARFQKNKIEPQLVRERGTRGEEKSVLLFRN